MQLKYQRSFFTFFDNEFGTGKWLPNEVKEVSEHQLYSLLAEGQRRVKGTSVPPFFVQVQQSVKEAPKKKRKKVMEETIELNNQVAEEKAVD